MRWTSAQAAIRVVVMCVLALVPLATLVHRNDVGRWDVQRSAMAAPDEFSYLLMARHFLHGGSLSLQDEIGRDTFYPPGYPLLLAAWWKCFGVSAFTAHALNATLLCGAVVVVYFFCRRLLLDVFAADHRRFALSPDAAANLAVVIAGIFATNWHVLETALLIMSEPAFMLATFGWLALALKWRDWHAHPGKTLAITLLAVAAWSIRGAGIVCVATSIVFPLWTWLQRRNVRPNERWLRLASMALLIGIPAIYQVALAVLSPEKSLTSAEKSANSYPRQLLHGLMIQADPAHPPSLPGLVLDWLRHIYYLVFGHLADFTSSFVPWLRENPDYHFRDVVGKLFAFFGLAGFTYHVAQRWPKRRTPDMTHGFEVAVPPSLTTSQRASRFQSPATDGLLPGATTGSFLTLYVLLYIGLYLIWPFNMARFWSPILPIMLVFGVHCVRTFGERPAMPRLVGLAPASALLVLLLALGAVEDWVQLGNYARRLNYVSDALAGGVEKIIRVSPDGPHTIIAGLGDEELFAMAWYFSQARGGAGYQLAAPLPHLGGGTGRREHGDEMLVRCLQISSGGNSVPANPQVATQVFFFSYFPNVDTHDTIASLAQKQPGVEITRVYQKEIIVSVWGIKGRVAGTQRQGSGP